MIAENPLPTIRTDPHYSSDGPVYEPSLIEDEEREASVERLMKSKTFARSPRLLSFLKYVCDQTLAGALDELSEQQVGMKVFGRPASYNPGEDNIVRTTARQLRQRLALYYQEEGKAEKVQVDMPRGGYAVAFRLAASSEEAQLPDAESSHPVPEAQEHPDVLPPRMVAPARNWMTNSLMLLLGVCLALAGVALSRVTDRQNPPSSPLWVQMFDAEHRTILAPGDAGLNLYDNVAKTEVSLDDYVSGRYLQQSAADLPKAISWAPFADRRYTSIVDLTFTDRLRQQRDFHSSQYEIRFARDLKMDDFRGAKNLILLGASPYNPWVQLFDGRLNFKMHYDGPANTITVLNAKPKGQEASTYEWSVADPGHKGYATISLVPNLDGKGSVLLIQGTTVAGMDGATTFLFDNPEFPKLLRKASNGKIAPFELLLETRTLLSSSSEAHVIAERQY